MAEKRVYVDGLGSGEEPIVYAGRWNIVFPD